MARRPSYSRGQRTQDQRRSQALIILTQRRANGKLEGYTAEQLASVTGLALPEAAAMIEHARLLEGLRG